MKPNVFVSSTCFDLTQVRRDIEETIEKIGFNPVLSDRSTFPVNPNEELITNCINNVSKNADILILIIGNRYGSKSESGKSITNIEYDTARQVGIPIFVFIKKDILNYLEVWKSNKDGDFSKQVDTTEIFEFVNKIREKDKVWSFEFINAQEISSTFISQMAFKFKELLDINIKLENAELLSIWSGISSKAKKILIDQNLLYEMDFFRQVVSDELSKIEYLKTHYDYNILMTCKTRLDEFEIINSWYRQQLKSLHNFVNTFSIIINDLFPKYYGEPGVSSDKKGLLLVAHSFGKLMTEMLQWSLDVKNISVPDYAENLRDTFSKFLDQPIKTAWNFPIVLGNKLIDLLERYNRGERNINDAIVFKLEISDELSLKFKNELDRLSRMAR